MRPSILCISFSDIQADARVLRQLDILSEFGDVTTLGYGEKPRSVVEHLELDASLPSLPQTVAGVVLLAVRAFRKVELMAPAVHAARRLLEDRTFDLVVANEARALPLAHLIAGHAPVWGDMHEWAPEERVHVLSWRLLVKPYMTAICSKYLPQTDAVTVVNDSIGRLYEEQFSIEAVTVRNARPFIDLQPSAQVPGVIRLVHSGAAIPGRNLEGMISATGKLGPGYTLDLYLVTARDGGKYLRFLESLAANTKNVTLHRPVTPEDLPITLNQYDVGIFSLPPQTKNHALMLPNKFFDFVQARLAIVFSPSPETSRLINEYDLGVIAEDFSDDALADALRQMTSEGIALFKSHAHLAARTLSSDRDQEAQRKILKNLLP